MGSIKFATLPPLSPARAIVYGGIAVGTLDALDAVIFFGLWRGVAPIRIFQSIASGLLGRASFQGGLTTAFLGGVLHYFIAFAIVTVYYAASRRLTLLTRRPVLAGAVYGVLVYLFMNLVVLPLSAANRAPFVLPVVLNGLFIHVVGVGLPSALFSRAASPPAE